MLLMFAKFIFHNIRDSVTLLSILNKLTGERPIKPHKYLSAYLLALAYKTKYTWLYYPDYILTDTNFNLGCRF